MNFKEFRPALGFLGRFLALYLLSNLAYGLFITWYDPEPDPATAVVTYQSVAVLDMLGYETETRLVPGKPHIAVDLARRPVIVVYEGCNGVNVMIVFLSFLFAYGPFRFSLAWFALLGLAVVHVANLVRVTVLFYVALNFPSDLYFLHKYFFSAFLYAVVFALWYIWVRRNP